jgi:hypothetical protein
MTDTYKKGEHYDDDDHVTSSLNRQKQANPSDASSSKGWPNHMIPLN